MSFMRIAGGKIWQNAGMCQRFRMSLRGTKFYIILTPSQGIFEILYSIIFMCFSWEYKLVIINTLKDFFASYLLYISKIFISSLCRAPFTIQRLCEIMIDPTRHYKRTDKFLRGLEKNVLVVSNIEPGRQ